MAQVNESAGAVADKLNASSDSQNEANSVDKSAPSIVGPMPLPGKTADEMYEELKSTPLFMTEIEDNDAVAAFQALDYEGTPLENATDFKNRGNEFFRSKQWKDAREFYTKGVEILWIEERKRSRGQITKNPETNLPDSPEEITRQKQMLESLYSNRAACNLELKNFRACWEDCTGALRLNPANVKCWYRSSKALLSVDRLDDATEALNRGLALDPENKSLLMVKEATEKRRAFIEAKKKADEEREATKKRRELLVRTALEARKITVRNTEKPPDMEDAAIRLAPNEDDPTSSLTFPTMLLYPTDYESDFIKAWSELDSLEAHLDYIFPLPWDTEQKYSIANVECYMETVSGGLLKIGKKLSLLRILSGGKVEVVDQVVKIFVVPKNKSEAWIKEFKEAKAKQQKKY
ncbi:Hsp70/Hsp90 co-chaperone cns1 [Ceratocystis fimbriata CBS 114723]|uniref:Hsp70/Hsp90 co-chaperone cns1 n=1 Tax=Ceratocystis fimbriata CBS 114723 TaxID=1035309 RepID=A0A2C5WY77_9PEZI|nr:Hsp70/Hsp90 co-chaperone cns1 [Ceratocystis fimbriata CBS 114723]